MTMLKSLGAAIDLTVVAAQNPVELGETPFFPGGNAILHLSEPVGGAGVVQVQGSDTETGTFTTLQSITAASGQLVEIANLPKWIRLNVSTAGTGTPDATLEGVQ